jgi:hypothetical protein
MSDIITVSRTDTIRIALGAAWLALRLSPAPQKRATIAGTKRTVFDEPDMPEEPDSVEYGIEDAQAGIDAALAYCDATDTGGDTLTAAARVRDLLAPASVVSACVGAAMAGIFSEGEIGRTLDLCEAWEHVAPDGAPDAIVAAHDRVIRLVLTGEAR